MKKLLLTSIIFLLTSCSTFRVSTLNYDPIYGPDGTEIATDVIENEFQLARKFRTDFTFRYNFAQYAMDQPYSWYFSNRMFNRANYWGPYSRFNMYNNSHNFWMNWAFDYPFNNFGYNWRDPYGFGNYYSPWNNYGMYGYGNHYGYNNWNNRDWRNNSYNVISNRNRENISYNIGRRGSNSSGRRTNTNTTTNNNVRNYTTPRSSTVGSTLNIDNVVEIIRKENKGRSIRVYTNPNNLPDVIIRGNNSRNNNTRIYQRPNNNSTNNNSIRNNYRPSNNIRSTPTVRSNSSTPRSSSSSTRSSNTSTKGGRGINNN